MKSLLGPSHPHQVVMYDPELSSLNLGDQVISRSAQTFLNGAFSDKFIVSISTHQPIPFRMRRYLKDSACSFVLGSNLLHSGMLFGFRQWNISILDTLQINNLVLVGCGWRQYESTVDPYSKALYRRILSSCYVHSVRDEYTRKQLASIGITNVINTGCPSLWGFTPDFCGEIPESKSLSVVTTVTDYDRNYDADQRMLNLLGIEYEHVYVWPQGSNDIEYLRRLRLPENTELLPATMSAYEHVLRANDVDYVGTRLHGGVKALQNKRRSLILAIDNRAREMGNDFGLPVLDREEIGTLGDVLNSPIPCEIQIDQEAIELFLGQFTYSSGVNL